MIGFYRDALADQLSYPALAVANLYPQLPEQLCRLAVAGQGL
jgi:hypothetical protein